jgi:hypothetical protein
MIDKICLNQLKTQSNLKRKANHFTTMPTAQVKRVDNLNFGPKLKTIINLRVKLNPDQTLTTYPVIDRSKLDALKSKIENKYKIQLQDRSEPKELESDYSKDFLPAQTESRSTLEPKFLTYSSLNMPQQTAMYTSPSFNGSIFYNPIFNRHLQLRMVTSLALIALLVFGTALFFSSMPANVDSNRLATADQKSSLTPTEVKQNAYKSWIESQNNGIFSSPEEDLDKDGLTNYEEFLINSNPVTPFSCNAKISDTQNLSNLINPASCKAIDLTNPEEINKFREIITIPEINIEIDKNRFNKNITEKTQNSSQNISNSSQNAKTESKLEQQSETKQEYTFVN